MKKSKKLLPYKVPAQGRIGACPKCGMVDYLLKRSGNPEEICSQCAETRSID